MLTFVLLAATSQAVEWIDRLDSDSVDKREEADRRLLDLDQAAIPDLEKAAGSADAELRGRAKGILAELARRVRVRPFRHLSVRLSLTL